MVSRAIALPVALALGWSASPAIACDCCQAAGPEWALPQGPVGEQKAVFRVAALPVATGSVVDAAAIASPDLEVGVPVTIEADRIDLIGESSGSIEATGHVHAVYQGFELRADGIRFDRRTLLGEASGSVRLDQEIYHLKARSVRFNLAAQTADATDWQAIIDKQGWFGGARLHLAADLFYSEDARISPCVHEDPGYWLSADRFEWYPRRRTWNLRGQYVKILVSNVPILWIPFFAATIGEAARRSRIELPETQLDATAGLDGAQGLYIDSQAKYDLGPKYPGQIPVRVMSSRGISAGVVQEIPTDYAQGKFETNYTQYFPWIPASSPVDQGRSGLHSNLSFIRDWVGGARSILNLGYRVDVGHRSDVQYQVDPGGFPIHRLPELITSWPSKGIGQVTVAPSVRAAYLIEDQSGNQSGLLQGNLGLGLPRWQPNSFWDMGFYGGANASYYFQDRSQSVLNLGLGTNQHWHPRFSTNLNLETQPVYTTGIGTPFNHDRATAVDRVLFGCNWAVYGPWNVGVGGFYARQWTDPLALSSFKLGDLYYNFRYNVNCLSWGITFRPPRPDQNQPFQYFFDFNIITF